MSTNGKILIDLFFKEHLGSYKLYNSRKVFRCCSYWMRLPLGRISPQHTAVFAEVELLDCNASSAHCIAKNVASQRPVHSLLLGDCFLSRQIFWSLHNIIIVMKLVTFTWDLARKRWCKKHSEASAPVFHWLAVSTHSEVTRSDIVTMSGGKTGFHLVSNASWGLMKRFLLVYFWVWTE